MRSFAVVLLCCAVSASAMVNINGVWNLEGTCASLLPQYDQIDIAQVSEGWPFGE